MRRTMQRVLCAVAVMAISCVFTAGCGNGATAPEQKRRPPAEEPKTVPAPGGEGVGTADGGNAGG